MDTTNPPNNIPVSPAVIAFAVVIVILLLVVVSVWLWRPRLKTPDPDEEQAQQDVELPELQRPAEVIRRDIPARAPLPTIDGRLAAGRVADDIDRVCRRLSEGDGPQGSYSNRLRNQFQQADLYVPWRDAGLWPTNGQGQGTNGEGHGTNG